MAVRSWRLTAYSIAASASFPDGRLSNAACLASDFVHKRNWVGRVIRGLDDQGIRGARPVDSLAAAQQFYMYDGEILVGGAERVDLQWT